MREEGKKKGGQEKCYRRDDEFSFTPAVNYTRGLAVYRQIFGIMKDDGFAEKIVRDRIIRRF